ncbi:MAG: heavy-metal-associated domain-containing protein [Bacteroidales bacterium]|jgi:copper chaperone CopZ|nr:heavy-metal-associated domain-containing protein [Bacteroidales bacterium]
MKTLLLILALALGVAEVTFETDLHCKNCVKKVEENIAFERGVKDLKVSLEEGTIYIKYDAKKTNVEKLTKAINKLGYQVKPIEEKPIEKTK